MIQSIDVTGLPQDVVDGLQSVVNGIRQTLPTSENGSKQSADEWVADFMAWASSHPLRIIDIDDTRETIYASRGE